MADKKTSSWGGHPLLSPKDSEGLELAAAVNEYHHGMPRDQAEKTALDAYRREHHAKAAAHHLMGLRAAQASGSTEDARKHFDMYGLHLKALGHEPHEGVPAEVKQHTVGENVDRAYNFRGHGADQFLVQTVKKHEVPHDVFGYFEELHKGDVIPFPLGRTKPADFNKPKPPAQVETLDSARYHKQAADKERARTELETKQKAHAQDGAQSFRNETIQKLNAGTASADEVNSLDAGDVWDYLQRIGLPRPQTVELNPYYLHRTVQRMREGLPGAHDELVTHMRSKGGELKNFSLAQIPAQLRMRPV